MYKFRETINKLLTEKETQTSSIFPWSDFYQKTSEMIKNELNPLLVYSHDAIWYGMPGGVNNEPDFTKRFKIGYGEKDIIKADNYEDSMRLIKEVKPVHKLNKHGRYVYSWEMTGNSVFISYADLNAILQCKENEQLRNYILRNHTNINYDKPADVQQTNLNRWHKEKYDELKNFCIEASEHLPSFSKVEWLVNLKQKFETNTTNDADSKALERLNEMMKLYDKGYNWEYIDKAIVQGKTLTPDDIQWNKDDVMAILNKFDMYS